MSLSSRCNDNDKGRVKDWVKSQGFSADNNSCTGFVFFPYSEHEQNKSTTAHDMIQAARVDEATRRVVTGHPC